METTGIYDIPNGDYHGGQGYSKSQLDLVRKAPALLKWSRSAPASHSDAAEIGTAFHCLLLEPEEFSKRYTVGPDCDRRSNENKARWERFESSLGTLKAISNDDLQKIHEMRDSALAHPEVAAILGIPDGVSEKSVYWRDEQTGLLCRCRPDWWSPSQGLIADMKTTDDIEKFHWSARDYRYDVQDAFYRDGVSVEGYPVYNFIFIVVGKKRSMGRYPVEVIQLDPTSVERARAEYREDLNTIADCKRTGHWPGVQYLTVPPRYNP